MDNIALCYVALVLAEYLVHQCLFIQKYIFIMGYKCAVVGCRTGYQGGEKHSIFFFPKYLYLKDKWGKKFVIKKDWHPTNYSVICAKHFDNKYIKEGKKCNLQWELQPIPTINSDSSLCVVPCIPCKPPTERNICNGEWNEFKANDVIHNLNSISPDICLKDFTFLKQETFVLMYRLIIDEITKIPVIHESIMVIIIIVFKSIIIPCKHGLDCSCSGRSPLCTILGNLSSKSFYT